jgi:hypothetical protein
MGVDVFIVGRNQFGEAAAKKANFPPHFAPFLAGMRPLQLAFATMSLSKVRVNKGRDYSSRADPR